MPETGPKVGEAWVKIGERQMKPGRWGCQADVMDGGMSSRPDEQEASNLAESPLGTDTWAVLPFELTVGLASQPGEQLIRQDTFRRTMGPLPSAGHVPARSLIMASGRGLRIWGTSSPILQSTKSMI